jgi:hypothetical protein
MMQQVQEDASRLRKVMLQSIVDAEQEEWMVKGNVDKNMMVWKWSIEMKILYRDACLVAHEFGEKRPLHPFDTFTCGGESIYLPEVEYPYSMNFDTDCGYGHTFDSKY